MVPGLMVFVKDGSWTLRQRSVIEVRYPSQKFSMMCGALPDPKAINSAGFQTSNAHANKRDPGGNVVFMDGHASFVLWHLDVIQIDPEVEKAKLGFDWSSPGWQDLR